MFADPSLWHLDPEVDFLNHGSFGACPIEVLEVQRDLLVELERQPIDFLWSSMEQRLDEAILAPARLLGCSADDLVFVENATSAVNAVLRSFDWCAGDAVITTTHAYGAVANALRYVAERYSLRLIEVEVPFPVCSPDQVVHAIRDALDRAAGVRMAVLDHITSKTGLILPIAELVELCHERGVPVLVDGAHVPGQLPVCLDEIGADWYTGNLHKWAFAPKGCAVLHARPEWQATTHPPVISHGLGLGFRQEFHWIGTRDPTAWLSAPAAIAFLERLGVEALFTHNHALVNRAADRICEAWGTERPAPQRMCGAMVTMRPPVELAATEAAARELHDSLRARGIEVPVFPFGGSLWIRISAQAYSRLQHYEGLATAFG